MRNQGFLPATARSTHTTSHSCVGAAAPQAGAAGGGHGPAVQPLLLGAEGRPPAPRQPQGLPGRCVRPHMMVRPAPAHRRQRFPVFMQVRDCVRHRTPAIVVPHQKPPPFQLYLLPPPVGCGFVPPLPSLLCIPLRVAGCSTMSTHGRRPTPLPLPRHTEVLRELRSRRWHRIVTHDGAGPTDHIQHAEV